MIKMATNTNAPTQAVAPTTPQPTITATPIPTQTQATIPATITANPYTGSSALITQESAPSTAPVSTPSSTTTPTAPVATTTTSTTTSLASAGLTALTAVQATQIATANSNNSNFGAYGNTTQYQGPGLYASQGNVYYITSPSQFMALNPTGQVPTQYANAVASPNAPTTLTTNTPVSGTGSSPLNPEVSRPGFNVSISATGRIHSYRSSKAVLYILTANGIVYNEAGKAMYAVNPNQYVYLLNGQPTLSTVPQTITSVAPNYVPPSQVAPAPAPAPTFK